MARNFYRKKKIRIVLRFAESITLKVREREASRGGGRGEREKETQFY